MDINATLASENFAAAVDSSASVEQASQVFAELRSLDTNFLNTQGFLTLVRQLNITTQSSSALNSSQRRFHRDLFRLANQKLVEFSKTHQAWQVVFEILLNSAHLDDQSVFQAASILKNKTMFDYVAFRVQLDANAAPSI